MQRWRPVVPLSRSPLERWAVTDAARLACASPPPEENARASEGRREMLESLDRHPYRGAGDLRPHGWHEAVGIKGTCFRSRHERHEPVNKSLLHQREHRLDDDSTRLSNQRIRDVPADGWIAVVPNICVGWQRVAPPNSVPFISASRTRRRRCPGAGRSCCRNRVARRWVLGMMDRNG